MSPKADTLLCFSIGLAITASQLHGHGAYHDKVAELSSLMKKKPDDVGLRHQLALAHIEHEEWSLCLAELDAIGTRLSTAALRGRALHGLGKNTEARAVLDAFLATEPKRPEALLVRSQVLLALGEKPAAIADARLAAASADSPPPHLHLAKMLRDSGDSAAASAALDEAIEKVGPDPEILALALECDTTAGETDRALTRLAALQTHAPSPEPWMAKRAEILAAAGREADARAAWTTLRDHLSALPTLRRGTPQNQALSLQALTALGESSPPPVSIPPAK